MEENKAERARKRKRSRSETAPKVSVAPTAISVLALLSGLFWRKAWRRPGRNHPRTIFHHIPRGTRFSCAFPHSSSMPFPSSLPTIRTDPFLFNSIFTLSTIIGLLHSISISFFLSLSLSLHGSVLRIRLTSQHQGYPSQDLLLKVASSRLFKPNGDNWIFFKKLLTSRKFITRNFLKSTF